jgi:flagellar protein FliS
MKATYARQYAKHYNQVALQTRAEEAGPHRLVQMLFEGALEKIAVARGHLTRGDTAEKGRHISWAISIIEGLRTSLDVERGGEIANNLNELYDYMKRRLLEANLSNDGRILDEVTTLLREIKGAWDAIAPGTGS